MIAGIPVIATDHRSIPELVKDGVNGLLVPPRDPDALADAIGKLYHDRQLIVELGKKNWEMRTHFDTREVVPAILRQMGVNWRLPRSITNTLPAACCNIALCGGALVGCVYIQITGRGK